MNCNKLKIMYNNRTRSSEDVRELLTYTKVFQQQIKSTDLGDQTTANLTSIVIAASRTKCTMME